MADVKESAMTQQSDCKWVRALDANGNSIRISKEDLAQVVGGLLGTASAEKNGLISSDIFKKQMQTISLSNNAVRKIANFKNYTFSGFLLLGVSSNDGNIVQVAITKDLENIKIQGQKPYGLKFHRDSNETIYIQCEKGADVEGILIGEVMTSIVTASLPVDAVELRIN